MAFPKVLRKAIFSSKHLLSFQLGSLLFRVLPGNGRRISTGEAKDVHLYGNAAAPTEHIAAGEISGHANNGVRDVFILKK
ncbi:hypothetical protein CEXT_462471 [Caerostris extrusa]|uniref:Uncharacterized protein n=1 Tax=Caerostris extrusa TaxID=172846 RepID=A0AAV4WMU2_CAEEX|nr:hypothetical protein CEXT_462471 [Caerostris extrusa]